MTETVALWAPDIEPPDDWLVPAILYQDKIATFAPEPYLDDRDGRASRRIERLLGDLYEPVSLPAAFAQGSHVERELQARVPHWIATALRLDPRRHNYIGRWADRAQGFDRRRREVLQQVDEIPSMIQDLRKEERRVAEALEQQRALVRLEEDRLASMKAAPFAPLVERIRVMRQRRSKLDRTSEEYADVCRVLDELRVQIEATRRSADYPKSEIRAFAERIEGMRSDLRGTESRLSALRYKIEQLLSQREKHRNWIDRPWEGDREFTAANLWALPPELDTIAVGKIYGPIFEFLASSAGMWVAGRPDISYVGTLVGPRFVVEDIMLIIAAHIAADRDDCVLLLSEQRRRALSAPTDALTAAAAVTWLLPVPQTS